MFRIVSLDLADSGYVASFNCASATIRRSVTVIHFPLVGCIVFVHSFSCCHVNLRKQNNRCEKNLNKYLAFKETVALLRME